MFIYSYKIFLKYSFNQIYIPVLVQKWHDYTFYCRRTNIADNIGKMK